MRENSENPESVKTVFEQIQAAADKLRATYDINGPEWNPTREDEAARVAAGMSINEWIAHRLDEYEKAVQNILSEHAPGCDGLRGFYSDEQAANVLLALQALLASRTGATDIGATPDDDKANEGDDSGAEKQTDEAPVTGRTYDDIVSEWVWVVGLKRFVRVKDSKMWDREQFDSRFNHFVDTASVAANIFKTAGKMRRFDGAVFRPGLKMIVPPDFNLWRASNIVPKAGNTDVWNEHLDYLFAPEDKDHVLNWLAWVYQNQSSKPNHALLLVGENTGTGKSFVARVFERLIGVANTQRPKNSSLKGDFNGWVLRCKLCIIEELMMIGKKEVANELRDVITEPTIECNIKNVPAQLVENYMAMMGISNHPDALPIDKTDRRWLVVATPVHRRDPEYYNRLFTILDGPQSAELLAAVAYELKTRKLGAYDGKQTAPMTDAKREMIGLSRKPLEAWLYDNRLNWPLNQRLINVRRDLITPCEIPADLMSSSRTADMMIAKFLRTELAGVNLGDHDIPSTGGRTTRNVNLWAINGGMAEMQKLGKAARVRMYLAQDKNRPVDDDVASDFAEGDDDVVTPFRQPKK